MRILTTKEFRSNQKTFFDLAEKERIIIHRGRNRKPILLMPIEESDASDSYYNPSFVSKIKASEKEALEGKKTLVKDITNIWESIL